MTARILDGKSLAAATRTALKQKVDALVQRGVRPGLTVIIAGDNPASKVYVRNKTLAAEETGVRSWLLEFGKEVSETELMQTVAALNADPAVHGILVQLPLPRHIDAARVLESIAPAKDVDGFHEANLGALMAGRPGVVPCTPLGCMRLIEHAGVQIAGRHAVVVGRSNIVGKPLAHLLLQKDATVTICHSKSADLGGICKSADILVAAVGRAKLVGAGMVKPGACVIDVGINRLPEGKLAGDVDFDAVKDVAGWITPVPGGVGPMTIAMLLENCIRAASKE
ncbi:MAG TPA: bifunctional methylenetetrahydrofolate dehydrogenase/methenyltetrahydrofolate cyclohydrolase FolD [Burkholderiales bacterium]|jgi:methylenetetrahydrofolate dehydrogenase (NADP+)/methenyltetrahydrofolate cyclohydrolase|nr:bifunctional methylenetetrahydrofolate dehydrogenase/methenyltetrahydrofolate cyclohydrolase FolD [Burkholderiales bacterium]